MIKGDVIFCATGVTDGEMLKGIVDKAEFFEASSFILQKSSKISKKVKNLIKK
jgi:fructose-1,6-bisphosphatase/sedoheptulose 1,7-bisphosphatase-like protein